MDNNTTFSKQEAEEEKKRLHEEINNAEIAQNLYDLYAKEFISRYNEKCYNMFKSLSINDKDELINIKLLQISLQTLEKSILDDIQTGELAVKQLEKLGNE